MKVLVLTIFTTVFIYEVFLNILNLKSSSNKIPSNVSDVYDESNYSKWLKYHKERIMLNIIFHIINYVTILLLLVFDFFAYIDNKFENVYAKSLGVFVIFILIDSLISLVQEFIINIIIEQKYGFNKMSVKSFLIDQIKKLILSTVIVSGLLALFMVIHINLGNYTILLFGIVLVALILLIIVFYPKFNKIFNKYEKLEDGELRDKLYNLLDNKGFLLKDILVMKESLKSTKVNAYFSGSGKTKTIVLYDTLIDLLTTDEIVAVFSHELGHGLHKDSRKSMISSIVNVLLIVVLAYITVSYKKLYTDFGFDNVNYGFALILIMNVEFSFIMPFVEIISSHFSRKAEYKADSYAVSLGYGLNLITALKKLAVSNYINLAPNKFLVLLSYSHPTISQRISNIDYLINNK